MMLLTAIASICDGQLEVYMQNGHQIRPLALAVTVAADATVRDLAQELLNYPAEATGLPQGFVTGDAIIISHGGRELDASESLADAGVGSEAALWYGVREQALSAIAHPNDGSHLPLDYHVPFGHPDVLGLMVEQTRENLVGIGIPDGTVMEFKFMFTNTTTEVQMPDQMKEVNVPDEYWYPLFWLDGTIRVIERVLLNKGSVFDFGRYNKDNVTSTWGSGGWVGIEKPVILETFLLRVQKRFVIRHLVGDRQSCDALMNRAQQLSIDVEMPESLTFLFDVAAPRRLV